MFKQLSPEEQEAKRLEREAREAREHAEQQARERDVVAGFLGVVGVVLMLVGVYFLLLEPGQQTLTGNTIVNLHRLNIGQTACIVGAIFFASGLHLRASV